MKFLLSYKLAWNCHNITIFSFDDPPEVASSNDIKISTDGSLKMAKSFSQCFSPDSLSKLAQLQQIRTLSKKLVLWYSFLLCQAAEENMSSMDHSWLSNESLIIQKQGLLKRKLKSVANNITLWANLSCKKPQNTFLYLLKRFLAG